MPPSASPNSPHLRKVLFVEDEQALQTSYERFFDTRYEMAFASTGANVEIQTSDAMGRATASTFTANGSSGTFTLTAVPVTPLALTAALPALVLLAAVLAVLTLAVGGPGTAALGRVHGRLDRPIAQMPLQLSQAHQVRQPRVC